MSKEEAQAMLAATTAMVPLAGQPIDVAEFERQLEALRAEVEAKKSTGVKAWMGRIGKGIAAAFTTSEAISAEKSLAAMVVVRILLFAGASAATVDGVKLLLNAVGVK